MTSITIRIARPQSAGDAVVTVHRWREGRMAAPAATARIAAADLAAGGVLDPATIQARFIAGGTAASLEDLGRRLHDAVFADDVARLWATVATPGLRVLLAIEDAKLARLPWELMLDANGLPVFFSPDIRFMRYVATAAPASALPPSWPIRLLIVIACSAQDAVVIGADDEVAAIRSSLRPVDHSFDIDVMDARRVPCNAVSLRGRIQAHHPHVLHFIGHASFQGNSGELLLWDRTINNGTYVSWRARDLTTGLGAIRPRLDLRLAYLNACRTQVAAGGATASPQAAERRVMGVASLSQALLAAGVPAVISMQADVHGEAAREGAAMFYARLAGTDAGEPHRIADGDSIDAALAAGRTHVQLLATPGDPRQPYCPVLTVDRDPASILRYQSGVADATVRDLIETCETLRPVRDVFVNQIDLRRDVVAGFFSPGPGQQRSAAVFHGLRDAGKTWLAKWLLAAWAFRGHQVLYLETRSYDNWLEMMKKAATQGTSGHFVRRPLPSAARDYFFWVLNHVARGVPVPPGNPPAAVADETEHLTAAILRDNEAVPKIMAAFLQALRIAAGEREMLLVFDHLHAVGDHGVAEATVNDLRTHLWEVIAEDHASPVKLLLILPPATSDASGTPHYPAAHWRHVALKEIPDVEVSDLLLEFYRLRYREEPSAFEREVLTGPQNPMLHGGLEETCKFVRSRFRR